MPQPALIGTYPHPGVPGGFVTAGADPARSMLAHIFRNGPVPMSFDIETFGLGADATRIKCVTLSTPDNAVVLDPREPAQHAEARRAFDYARELYVHNGPFDCPSLAVNNLLEHRHIDKVTDALVWARIAEPGERTPKTLDAVVERYLGLVSGKIGDLFRSLGYRNKTEGFYHLDIDAPAYLWGAGADGLTTARIMPLVWRAAMDRLVLGHPFPAPIGLEAAEAAEELAKSQRVNRWGIEQTIHGLRLDLEYLDRYRAETGRRRAAGEASLRAVGIDPGNGNHLTRYLAGEDALPADHRRTDTGKLGAADADLEHLQHPAAQVFRQVKASTKLDGYLQKCVDMAGADNRIHPVTQVLKAAHGRDAMADPPLHQFPAEARGIILADTTFTSVDMASQEPRIAMNYAGDLTPLDGYEQRGSKLYQPIADLAEVKYKQAKIVVLAGLYGQGLGLLSSNLGLPPDPWVEEYTDSYGRLVEAHWGYRAAKDIQAAVFSAIPETAKYMKRGKQIAKDHRVAWTMNGRIVPIPSGFYKGKFSIQTHKWINYNVSGSAADELHNAIDTARTAGLGMAIRFGMHDELVVESAAAHDVRRIMEQPSERFCRISGRRPVIRTDMELMGERWVKPE